MSTLKKLRGLTLLFLLIAVPAASAEDEQQEETVVVGHISHVEGELLRYVPEDEDWVATVKDTPVGKDDVFYADKEVKAELIIPNNTWMRIGDNVQIEIVKLEDDTTEVDIDSGVARFYNKSSTAVLKVNTPYGHVEAPPHSTFDVYIKDESVEVIALKRRVQFVHVTDQSEFEVISGSSSVIASYQEVTSGKGIVDEDWHAWNVEMDKLWEKRLEKKGDSAKYLPERLYYESHALDEHGVWERVYYEGRYCHFWRPLYVSGGWSPFTVGRWTLWYGDHCWVPYEPFGYVTHHYGNWIYIRHGHRWYWAPPVWYVSMGVGPFLHIGFGWYPGRVSWIYRGSYIGWIPLAPFEQYYCRRYWGPRSIVVNNINIIDVGDYCYRDHAVIINRRHFYGVDNYNKFRLRHIRGRSIIDSYRGTPVINSRVIRDFKRIKDRFNFGNIKVSRKPHRSVIERIHHRRIDGRQFFKGRGNTITSRSVKSTPEKRVKHTSFKKPGVSNKIISAREFKKPERIRLEKRQQRTPVSIANKRRPKPEVPKPISKIKSRIGAPKFTQKPKGDKSIKRVPPRMNVPRFSPSPKAQKLLPSIIPRTKVPSFSSRPKVHRSMPRITSRSNVRRFTPRSRVLRSSTRSGFRMMRL